jgi:hypothetical protein
VTREPGVDESGRGMGKQAKSPERALALKTGGDVIRQSDELEGRTEHKLTRVKDERLVGIHLQEMSKVWLIFCWVNKGVLVVVEEPEEAVEPHVNARWLNHVEIKWFEADTARVKLGPNVAITEKHGLRLARNRGTEQTCIARYAIALGEGNEQISPLLAECFAYD